MSEIIEFHTKLQNDAVRWALIQYGHAEIEYRLPNNRIADIISCANDRRLIIIEVKTVLAPCLVDDSLTKYRSYCDELIIAAPASEISKLLKDGKVIDINNKMWECGYLWLTARNAGYFPCTSIRTMNAVLRRGMTARLKERSWGRVKSAHGRL